MDQVAIEMLEIKNDSDDILYSGITHKHSRVLLVL